MKLLHKLKQGFTLIELLVVIAIIGILVAVATVNLITAQKQARDARRIQDMEATQTAFETYYVEKQFYPTEGADDILDAFDSNTIPVDPKDDATYLYDWGETGVDSYCVCARLETKTGNADGGTVAGCTWNSTGDYFCIQNRQ